MYVSALLRVFEIIIEMNTSIQSIRKQGGSWLHNLMGYVWRIRFTRIKFTTISGLSPDMNVMEFADRGKEIQLSLHFVDVCQVD